MDKRVICVIGLPCSGKSHAAKNLAFEYKGHYISTGDMARFLAKTDEERKLTEKNDRFPGEEELRKMLVDSVEQSLSVVDMVFIDGFPRYGDQVEFLASSMWAYDPIIIEISPGSDAALWQRARERARSQADVDQFLFFQRLQLAKKNMGGVWNQVYKKLIPYTRIISINDDTTLTLFKQFWSNHGGL